jgi:hypothetical protein
MKANLLKSAIILTAVTGSAEQKNEYIRLKKQLKKDCDTLLDHLDLMYPSHSNKINIKRWKEEFDKNKVPTPKNFDECKETGDFSMNKLLGTVFEEGISKVTDSNKRNPSYEGLGCYVADKFNKIDAGLITNIETHNFNTDTFKLFEKILDMGVHDVMKQDNSGLYTLISKNTKFKEHEENFKKMKSMQEGMEDYIKFSFLAGEKEVPDFHRALFALASVGRVFEPKHPSKIVSTAILDDNSFSKEEKETIIKFLKNKNNLDNNGNVKTNSAFGRALKKVCQSIKISCQDSEGSVLLKGRSITGTSLYNLMAWDNTPLKNWVKVNTPAEKKLKEEL